MMAGNVTVGDMGARKMVPVIFEEGGVTITRTHLSVPGHIFAFAKIQSLRLERISPTGLHAKVVKGPIGFRLMVSTIANAREVTVFQTTDAEYMKRIESAINQAAAANKGKRIVWPGQNPEGSPVLRRRARGWLSNVLPPQYQRGKESASFRARIKVLARRSGMIAHHGAGCRNGNFGVTYCGSIGAVHTSREWACFWCVGAM